MSGITTHVLDTSRGRPAAGVAITLDLYESNGWRRLGAGTTDADGRCRTLLDASSPFVRGTYRIAFETGRYFEGLEQAAFYPSVPILFEVHDETQHFHVPLLLSPFGYSTYRGS